MPKVSEGGRDNVVIEQTDHSRRLMPGVQVNFMSRPRRIVRYSELISIGNKLRPLPPPSDYICECDCRVEL
jgi:hypothetical protein